MYMCVHFCSRTTLSVECVAIPVAAAKILSSWEELFCRSQKMGNVIAKSPSNISFSFDELFGKSYEIVVLSVTVETSWQKRSTAVLTSTKRVTSSPFSFSDKFSLVSTFSFLFVRFFFPLFCFIISYSMKCVTDCHWYLFLFLSYKFQTAQQPDAQQLSQLKIVILIHYSFVNILIFLIINILCIYIYIFIFFNIYILY